MLLLTNTLRSTKPARLEFAPELARALRPAHNIPAYAAAAAIALTAAFALL